MQELSWNLECEFLSENLNQMSPNCNTGLSLCCLFLTKYSHNFITRAGFEISLCGDLLCAGMGLSAAVEAFDAHRISEEEFKLSAASIIKNGKLVVKFQEMYLPWEKAAHIVLGMAVYGLDLPVDPNDAIRVEPDEAPKLREDDSGITSSPSARRWRLWPIPFRRVKTLDHTNSNLSVDLFVDSETSPTFRGKSESPHKQLLRTNVPTTEQIASLNLNEGQNLITFSFCTRVLGMQKVCFFSFLVSFVILR